MLSDLKYGLRQMRKSPGFTFIAVLILGLGIGANTAVFTAIDTLLLRALPVPNPQELVLLTNTRPLGSATRTSETLSFPAYEQLRDHAQSLSGVFAVLKSERSVVGTGLGQSKGMPVVCGEVSGNFFSVLGVPALSGRTLLPDDDRKDAPRAVAVLSYSFWSRKLGADPSVLGKTILIDNVPFAVVGIAPPGFFGVELTDPMDLWVPSQMLPILDPTASSQYRSPGYNVFLLMGRLRPGVKIAVARAELDVIFQGWLANLGLAHAQLGRIDLQPGGGGRLDHRGDIGSMLAILITVAGLVLVIACANIASLLLARSAARQRELAVRAALGAGRGRLLRQLMTEGLILAALGGGLGLMLVHWVTHLLTTHVPAGSQPSDLNLNPDIRVFLFAVAASAATGIFVGLIPAIQFSQIDLVSALKNQAGSATGGSRQRFNKALVVAQIAVSICLLAGAGLFVRTLQNLRNVDLGFKRENVLLFSVGFDKSYDQNRRANLARDLLTGFEALPGVRSASVSVGGLWDGHQTSGRITVSGYVSGPNEDMTANFVQAGPRFFENMGIPLLQGRGFNFADVFPTGGQAVKNTRVVVVNEALAKRFFGSTDPIGRHLSFFMGDAEIIGVARNTKYKDLRDGGSPEVFAPLFPMMGFEPLRLSLETTGNPMAIAPNVSAVVRRIDPQAQVFSLITMDDRVSHYLFQERLIAQVAGYFGLFALMLACLGLYGLLAYNVAQRTREIGVRMALGARPYDVLDLVVSQGLKLALVGGAIGIVSAITLIHFIASRLYGVVATDPVTFIATVLLLMAVALLACWLPACRATKVDPMVALRAE